MTFRSARGDTPLTFVSSKDRSSDSSAVGMDFVEVISYMLPYAIGEILKNLEKLPGIGAALLFLYKPLFDRLPRSLARAWQQSLQYNIHIYSCSTWVKVSRMCHVNTWSAPDHPDHCLTITKQTKKKWILEMNLLLNYVFYPHAIIVPHVEVGGPEFCWYKYGGIK